LPALSRPRMRTRTSFLPNSLLNSDEKSRPMLAGGAFLVR
jgi:hypothetical protein